MFDLFLASFLADKGSLTNPDGLVWPQKASGDKGPMIDPDG